MPTTADMTEGRRPRARVVLATFGSETKQQRHLSGYELIREGREVVDRAALPHCTEWLSSTPVIARSGNQLGAFRAEQR